MSVRMQVRRALERCSARSLDDEVDRIAVEVVVVEALNGETAIAQRDAALDALRAVIRYVQRIGGFMSAEDQAMLRGARALLAELGRKL